MLENQVDFEDVSAKPTLRKKNFVQFCLFMDTICEHSLSSIACS